MTDLIRSLAFCRQGFKDSQPDCELLSRCLFQRVFRDQATHISFLPERLAMTEKRTQVTPISKLANRFIREECGATAVEYGIMIAAISAVIITIVISVGSRLNSTFVYVDTEMSNMGN